MTQTITFNLWKSALANLLDQNKRQESLQIEEQLAMLMVCGQYCFYIVDYSERVISWKNHTFSNLFGNFTDAITFNQMIELIHPDDLVFVGHAESSIKNYFQHHIPASQAGNFKSSYCMRLKTRTGDFQLFQHQSVLLSADITGTVHQALIILTNISNITNSNNHKITLIDLTDNQHYVELEVHPTLPESKFSVFFTLRELEIIRLMAKGLKSHEIAGSLFISNHTVKKHRKNILHKADVKSSAGLISKCLSWGII